MNKVNVDAWMEILNDDTPFSMEFTNKEYKEACETFLSMSTEDSIEYFDCPESFRDILIISTGARIEQETYPEMRSVNIVLRSTFRMWLRERLEELRDALSLEQFVKLSLFIAASIEGSNASSFVIRNYQMN